MSTMRKRDNPKCNIAFILGASLVEKRSSILHLYRNIHRLNFSRVVALAWFIKDRIKVPMVAVGLSDARIHSKLKKDIPQLDG